MAGRKPGGPKTGGRQKGTPNKATADIKALAQQHGPAAFAAIVRIMQTAERDETRLAAAEKVLAYAYGRPATQELPPANPDSPEQSRLSDTDLARRLAFLLLRGANTEE